MKLGGAAVSTVILLSTLLAGCTDGGAGNAGPLSTRSGAQEPTPAATPVPTATAIPDPTARPTARPRPQSPATPKPTATATPSPPTGGTSLGLKVYFLLEDAGRQRNPTLVPVFRSVPSTRAVASAAMRELLAGPVSAERLNRPRISTAIPADTVLLGIDIRDGLATVDLSREFESGGGTYSMGARLAQVVYTLTQFPTVNRVNFRLDGKPARVFSGEGLVLEGPATRDQYLDYLPPIWVDSPAWGSTLRRPARITGKANVFEASLMVGIADGNGTIIASRAVTASCGTGCWGDFDVTLSYPRRSGQRQASVVVWSLSAQDGSRENVRAYPVYVPSA
jgi:germination protein M